MMKFGCSASELDAHGSPGGVATTARLAEDRGFDLVAMGDTQALLREVYSTLSLAGDRTDTIDVGPVVTNPVTRHPVVTASSICTLNEITNGRAMLGIATGDSAVFTVGETPAKLAEMERAIETIRRLVRGERVEDGDTSVRLQWLTEKNQPRTVPVFWAAEGPKTQRLAGKHADAVLLGGGITPELIDSQVENVEAGAREAGRDPDEVDIWLVARCNVDEDRERAVDALKPSLAGMAHHSLRHSLEGKGIPESLKDPLDELRRKYDSHQHHETGENRNVALLEDLGLTEFVADRYAIVGTEEDCISKVRDIQAVGPVDGIYLNTPKHHTRDAIRRFGDGVIANL